VRRGLALSITESEAIKNEFRFAEKTILIEVEWLLIHSSLQRGGRNSTTFSLSNVPIRTPSVFSTPSKTSINQAIIASTVIQILGHRD
jgi:hypothetical protein